MRGSIILILASLLLALAPSALSGQQFIRGDANGDGIVDIADPVSNLAFFLTGGASPCLDAQDVNDNGFVSIADPIYNLFQLFASGPPPPAPFPGCGIDPAPDALGCLSPPAGCGPVVPAPGPLFPGPSHAVGLEPYSVTLGDVDGDGDLDLATANFFSDDVSVLLNHVIP
ncbi:MAG: hypothetical protein ACE5GW_02755 [Planctomycetota bacterium]